MIPLDVLLTIVVAMGWLAINVAVAVAVYRRLRPYKVVGHSFELGMTAVRWRDDPDHTHWLTPDHLAQQKGLH
ncbi:hypothetical protein [Nonomuraea sp. NPDC050202]|uniref:hypothetical protein n=1 Tax=Nonomuraea sp. NPDC050202 TaxID=3155035 RepID=UPI0033FC8E6D